MSFLRSKYPRSVVNFVVLYFDNCCIHGFRYLVQSMLLVFERLLWLFLLIFSIYFCIISCLSSVDRFNHKSTHIGIDRNWYYWNIALPSLSICEMQRINENLFGKFCRERLIVGQDKVEFKLFMEALANSTYTNFENIPQFDSVDRILNKYNINPAQYMELIYNLTMDESYSADEPAPVRCTDGSDDFMTMQILTEFGLCYVCNSLLGPEYSARYVIFGEYPVFNPETFEKTKRANFHEKEVSLSFIGFQSNAIDAYMHSPYDVLRLVNNFGYTEEGAAYSAEMTFTTADPNFQSSTTVSQRNCRYFTESNLTHFPYYTRNTCTQECRLNLAYKICDCIPHFYPNLIANPKPVCSYKTLKSCFPRHANLFLKMYENETSNIQLPKCYCEPNCLDAAVRIPKVEAMKGAMKLLKGRGASITITSWAKAQFKRQVIFSFTDLLVSIGGTAGLYLGFSVLGLVEFIYFFTMRLIWHIYGYKL